MAPRTYTDEEKATARERYEADGLAATVEATGIPKGTLSAWITKGEWRTHAPEKMEAAIATQRASVEAKRLALALALFDDIDRLRAQLFAPVVERKVVTVSLGRNEGSEAQVVDVRLSQPTFGDQKAITTAVAIDVDKIQVLTGGATERIELTGDARTRAVELADELAERRASRARQTG